MTQSLYTLSCLLVPELIYYYNIYGKNMITTANRDGKKLITREHSKLLAPLGVMNGENTTNLLGSRHLWWLWRLEWDHENVGEVVLCFLLPRSGEGGGGGHVFTISNKVLIPNTYLINYDSYLIALRKPDCCFKKQEKGFCINCFRCWCFSSCMSNPEY